MDRMRASRRWSFQNTLATAWLEGKDLSRALDIASDHFPKKSLLSRRQTCTFGTKGHHWLLGLLSSSSVTEHLSAELPSQPVPTRSLSAPQADGQSCLPTSQGLGPGPEAEQPATRTHTHGLPPCPVCTGHRERWARQWELARTGNRRASGGRFPGLSPLRGAPWPGNNGSRARTRQLLRAGRSPGHCRNAGRRLVTVPSQPPGQRHRSWEDSPSSIVQGQSFSSTLGGLAERPPWLLSQGWVFHLQLDWGQTPTTRNPNRARPGGPWFSNLDS